MSATLTITVTLDVGDLARLKATFTDADTGLEIDPTTVTFRVRSPDGTLTDYVYPAQVVRTALGKFQMDVDIDQSGVWYWRAFPTGSGQAAEENALRARVSRTVA